MSPPRRRSRSRRSPSRHPRSHRFPERRRAAPRADAPRRYLAAAQRRVRPAARISPWLSAPMYPDSAEQARQKIRVQAEAEKARDPKHHAETHDAQPEPEQPALAREGRDAEESDADRQTR